MSASVPSPPLVGRERELATLREHLAATLAGQGSLILIGGEAGIGKSALAESLCREAMAQGALVLTGRCYDLTETPPYGPWTELFTRVRDAEAVPSFPAAFTQYGPAGAVASQSALVQQALNFFAALAAQRRVVLVLDDMHWADPASLDLLRLLARTLDALSLLILVTYRADELTRRHPLHTLLPLLEREASATRLSLHPLSRAAIQQLVTARYHLVTVDESRLVADLETRTEGNALYLVQFLRELEERTLIRPSDDGWMLGDLDQLGIPLPLQQVIDGRLGRLGEDAHRLLGMAAVIGQEVPIGLWTAVTGIDEETVLAVVERITEARIAEATRDGEGIRFVHALIREALYAGIPPVRRRVWHRQVAEALTASPHADPDSVADHFQRAGDARAAAWLIQAGERALRVYARATAATRFEAALVAMERHGASAGERGWVLYRLGVARAFSPTERAIGCLGDAIRLAALADDRVLAATALGFHGELRVMYGQVREGMGDMERAIETYQSFSAADHLRLTTLDVYHVYDEAVLRGALLADLGNAGYYAQALALGESIRAETAGSKRDGHRQEPLGTVEKGMALTYAALGQPEEARAAFARERAARIQMGDEASLVGMSALHELRYVILPYQTDDVAGRRRLADLAEDWFIRARSPDLGRALGRGRLPLLMLECEWQEARAVASARLALGGHSGFMDYARSELGVLARLQGEPTLARRMVDDELPAGRTTSPGDAPCFLDALLAQQLAAALALDAAELDGARAWLEMHDGWIAWSGSVRGRSEGQALWAEYWRAKGDHRRAWQHATRALDNATEPRQPLAALTAHRLLGELATAAAHSDDAAQHLDHALALAASCAAPYEKALTLIALGAARGAANDRTEALRCLEAARVICTPLGARPALARADALTARIGAAVVSRAYPAGLSAREVEVLGLMAAGQSNREIAAALFLSERTVHAHVRHILTKTDTENRAAATAFAVRNGLA